MSTDLLLRNTTLHGLTPTDGDAVWYDMVPSWGGVTDTCVVNTAASGTDIQFTKTAGGSKVAWISPPVPTGGFTLTSTALYAWCQESSMSANIAGQFRVFKRTAAGVVSECSGGPFALSGAEWSYTTSTGYNATGNIGDTSFAAGDRILLRIAITNIGTMATGYTGTLTFNGPWPGNAGASYFQIAETIAFDPPYSGTVLYLRNTSTHGLTPATDAVWLDLLATAGAATPTLSVTAVASGTEIQWATGSLTGWISGRVPAGGVTLTKAWVTARATESAAATNAGLRLRCYKRTAAGVVTELGSGPFDVGAEFYPTQLQNVGLLADFTDTAFAEDDRLLIRPYITNIGTMGAGTCTFEYDEAWPTAAYIQLAESVSFKVNSSDQTINCTAGALTLAAQACAITAGAITATCTAASLTLAAQSTTITPTYTLQATNAALGLTVPDTSITVGAVTIQTTAGALTLAITSPTVTPGAITAQTTNASLALAPQDATITRGGVTVQATNAVLALAPQDTGITPGAVTVQGTNASLTLTVPDAGVSQGGAEQTVNATAASLTLVSQAATITAAYTLQATNASLALSVPDTGVTVGAVTVQATNAALSLEAQPAGITVGAITAQTTAAELTLTIPNAVITLGGQQVNLTHAVLALTIPDAGITAGPVTVQATNAALSLAPQATTITRGSVTVQATAGVLTLALQDAGISTGTTVQATAAALTLAAQAATVTPGGVTVTATSAPLTLAAKTPTITTGPVTLDLTWAELTLTIPDPLVVAGTLQTIQTTAGRLTLTVPRIQITRAAHIVDVWPSRLKPDIEHPPRAHAARLAVDVEAT